MPKLLDAAMDTGVIPGLTGYKFSAVRTDRLGASEYTLVTLVIDVSTSVNPFRDTLVKTIQNAVDGFRLCPRANNILVRAITFGSDVRELHGFKPLAEIDNASYDAISVGGNTALYDATASAIGAMAVFGRTLLKQDFAVNGSVFVITDGSDNVSTYTASTVREKVAEIEQDEDLGACLIYLIGVNAKRYATILEAFRTEAALTDYIDAGDATPANLAKIGGFISKSVSSHASAQTGAPAAAGSITI
jgi:uncharacterized protein YegL